MGFGRINEIKKQRGMTNAQISTISGIPLSTLDKITAGINTNPKLDTMKALAAALKCRLDDFDDSTQATHLPHPSVLTKYHALDSHGKEVVDSVICIEYDRIQKEKGKPTPPPVLERLATRKLPVENSLASAGVGYELLDDLGEHEYIIVQDTAENAKAHFAVQVTGDSMEPMIHSGDYILICTTAPVDLHGIGLFVIDGEGMVKKFGGDTLISLNSKYEPRPYKSAYEDGECRCVGKVVNIIHDYAPEEFEE